MSAAKESFSQDSLYHILQESLQGKVVSSDVLESLQISTEKKAYAKTLHPNIPKEKIPQIVDLIHKVSTHEVAECQILRSPGWVSNDSSIELLFVCPNPAPRLLSFLFDLFRLRSLVIKNIHVSYVFGEKEEKIFVLHCDLQGVSNMLAWEVCDMELLIQEILLLNDFEKEDELHQIIYVEKKLQPQQGPFLRALSHLVEEVLGNFDIALQLFCKHVELADALYRSFSAKFSNKDLSEQNIQDVELQNVELDDQVKRIFSTAYHLVEHMLKTNYFVRQKKMLSFRLDVEFFKKLDEESKKRFPVTPYGVFYLYSCSAVGFHIRFQDIARGGLRTLAPKDTKPKHVLFECYELAHTQQKKNKDIPEGGAKGVLSLQPEESQSKERFLHRLYSAQKAYIESLLSLVNFSNDSLKQKSIIDLYKKPEYLYLGPDELMHDCMVDWIANYSKKVGYSVGVAFITGKKKLGFHHKQYGVTSHGLTACLELVLKRVGINPYKDTFSVKLSGGPDGDVAGNVIVNLHKRYKNTCRLLTLIDVSGLIYDPNGLDLNELVRLFHLGLPVRHYAVDRLSADGFLLDKETIQEKKTLLIKKDSTQWIDSSTAHTMFSTFVHETKTDVFIPGGGRPHSLSKETVQSFLDETGAPTSKVIVEGANLYLSHEARKELEEKGVLIIKDSSANKGGVISSSFEVLCNLVLTEDEFLCQKEKLIQEVLDRIWKLCSDETNLIFRLHDEKKLFYSEISDLISKEINQESEKNLEKLQNVALSKNPEDSELSPFFAYVLPLLKKEYSKELMLGLVDGYKKAVIATYSACQNIYHL